MCGNQKGKQIRNPKGNNTANPNFNNNGNSRYVFDTWKHKHFLPGIDSGSPKSSLPGSSKKDSLNSCLSGSSKSVTYDMLLPKKWSIIKIINITSVEKYVPGLKPSSVSEK